MATLTYKIVHETPPPPSTRNANLPAAVDGVLAKALAKAPSERFANCREFVGTLAGAFTAAPATITAPVVPVPATSRRPAVLAVAAVALCAGVALAVWKPWNRPASPKADPVAAVQPATTPPPPPSTAQPAIHKPLSAAKTVAAKHVADVPEPVDDAELPTSASTKTGETPFDKTMQRGHDLMKNRDYTGAIEAFTRAISLRPRNPMAYYSRGAAHQDLDQNELAVQDYSESIRLAPNLPLAYAGRGVCRVRLHRDEEAMTDFQRALELKPDQISALNGRAGVYFRRKEYRLALADYDAAIKSHPGVGRTYLNRARVKEATGDLRGAAADRRAEADLHER